MGLLELVEVLTTVSSRGAPSLLPADSFQKRPQFLHPFIEETHRKILCSAFLL